MNDSISLPDGPSRHNYFQLLKYFQNPIPVFEACKKIYGNTFTLRFPGLPDTVVISDPIDLKQVFSANSNQLHTGEINAILLQPILGDYSLLSLDGKKHLQHRKLLSPAFHGQKMQNYGELMDNIVKKKIVSWNTGDVLRLVDEARDMTYHVILSAIFGMNEKSSRFELLTKSLHKLINILSKPFSVITLLNPRLRRNLGPLTPWAKIMSLRRQVDACLFEEIRARKKINLDSRFDILSLLLQAEDEAGNRMTDQEIRDEMMTLLIAGHDTSTMGISWAMYGILSNPNVHKKLKEEFNHLISNEGDIVNNLEKLVYLDAVVKEALRLTPVLPYVTRITKDAYPLGKYVLPKGTVIAPCIYLAHHDPQHWPDSDKFIPERFLNTEDHPYTWLPFGHGIRRCIGAAFAQYEMKIIIAEILLRVELELKEGYTPKLERRGVVISPSHGLPVKVKRYLHSS